MSLNVRSDRELIRSEASSVRYLLVSFTAPPARRRAERTPLNMAFVLDRSGSMAGEQKFRLARQAVNQAIRMLRPEDRFALVVYDSEIDVLVESTRAGEEAKRAAARALDAVEPRASTDLCGGWMRGCEQIARYLEQEQVGRCLLVTDGLANQGITDRDTIVRHAGELRARGVSTSTIGVGSDFDEILLRDMAREGGGNAYHVSQPEQITDLLTSEVGEALEIVMRNAAIHVTLPAGARAMPLNALRHSFIPGDNELRVELENLMSNQALDVVIKVQFPRGHAGDVVTAGVSISDATNDIHAPAAEVRWTYASHAATDRQPRDADVDVEVATLYAARARAEATEHNRRGDYLRARRVLESTAERILGYANGDVRLLRLAHELRQEIFLYEAPMSPMEWKMSMYAAEAQVKSRAPGGRARRRDV